MADFRRVVTVLFVLALFVGVAAAQNVSNPPFVCNAVAQVTPLLRGEGVTEMVGDIVLTCTGGTAIAPGQPIPQANIAVQLTANVTSKVLNATTGAVEALLLVDEPNSGLPAPVTGSGPGAALTYCTDPVNPTVTCREVTASAALNPAVVPGGGTAVVATAVDGGAPYNVFQGLLLGPNQIIFQGIPVLPPATAGLSRVYRITNVRVNASAVAPASGGILPVTAFIQTSPSSAVPVSNPTLTVGFIQNSLTTKVYPIGATFQQCNGIGGAKADLTGIGSTAGAAIVAFTELFPTAFKTRYANLPTARDGSTQNVPGQQQLYNSESGFIFAIPTGNGNSGTSAVNAGQASFGTRLAARFSNLPAGVSIWVSQNPIVASISSGVAAASSYITPAPVPTYLYNDSTSYADYQADTETAAKKSATGTVVAAGGVNAVNLINTTTSNTSAVAVWEVTNQNQSLSETMAFAVYITYTPNTGSNVPGLTTVAGPGQVALTYAPLVAAATPNSTTAIPRFVQTATSTGFLNIVPCQTVLLFPYVTTGGGLDTGVAISNTSMDPFGTINQTGSCRLNFYGATIAATPVTANAVYPIGPIGAGNPDPNKNAWIASANIGNNVSGYIFAVCDFQYAHGFAFISDRLVQNIAMGYLALIVNGSGITPPARGVAAEMLEN